ncbi:adenylyl-sulfate kinase [Saccharothrix sp. Mg75]|uniref:adenylyl-sulfate kinase n=1 Tax=Saccharothrix sp. Mg75 TaxID=3445357 RepID=UPI003EED5CB3
MSDLKDPKAETSNHAVRQSGLTAWLTGLPSAGKSTIANGVASRLRAEGHRVEVLDGDKIRRDLTADLGFSRVDREENVRRIGVLAVMLARNGVTVLVSVIAPYAASREKVRLLHASEGIKFLEVHIATPVAVCTERDVKGLYARQRAGQLSGLTGVDDPYETPSHPDLRVFTDTQTEVESVDSVYQLISHR